VHRRVNLQNHCINLPGKRFNNSTVRARIDKISFSCPLEESLSC
jgi:hypothetical protein